MEESTGHHETKNEGTNVACEYCIDKFEEMMTETPNFFPDIPIGKFLSSAHVYCIKSLIKQNDKTKETILMASAAVGNTDVLQIVILCFNIGTKGYRKMGTRDAQMAARRGQYKVLKILLDLGINPDGCLGTGPPGLTGTYLVAANGHVKCLKLLLDSGFQGSPLPGFSPLYGAATNGHIDCIRLLIQGRCWGNDQGGEVLRSMASVGNIKILAVLVAEFNDLYLQELKRDPKQQRINKLQLSINFQAAARDAAEVGDTECLIVLLYSLAFHIHSKDSLQNLIHDAASSNHIECLSIP